MLCCSVYIEFLRHQGKHEFDAPHSVRIPPGFLDTVMAYSKAKLKQNGDETRFCFMQQFCCTEQTFVSSWKRQHICIQSCSSNIEGPL
jgi:hypothetical protein